MPFSVFSSITHSTIAKNYMNNITGFKISSINVSSGTYPLTVDSSNNGPDMQGTTIAVNGTKYNVYTFTIPNVTYTINYSSNNSKPINILAVGGGGSGGAWGGAGGGAGGVVMYSYTCNNGNNSIQISIGEGGPSGTDNSVGIKGYNTTVTLPSFTLIAGGGGGGLGGTIVQPTANNYNYTQYGSGGGCSMSNSTPLMTGNTNVTGYTVYANTGGAYVNNSTGGGGGGAGGAGGTGIYATDASGGNGIQCTLDGISTFNPLGTSYGTYYWGGGGGGGSNITNPAGNGGLGGGGGGSCQGDLQGTGGGSAINPGGSNTGTRVNAGRGGANTGGGGGGAWYRAIAGKGGSGIVIIAFPEVN